MRNDHAMAIVCDLALCMGREVTLDALLTKVLQRFMFHCDCPVGAIFQPVSPGSYRIIKAIGDEQLSTHIAPLVLPDWVCTGQPCFLHDTIIPLPGAQTYHFAYRFRIEGEFLLLLLSPQTQPPEASLSKLLSPVLANLARAIRLCQDSEQLAQRQQAELVDMQHLNESLLNTLPIPVCYKDTERRLINCNAAFIEQTGLSKADLIGKRVEDIVPAELAQTQIQWDLEVLANKQPLRVEYTLTDQQQQSHQMLNFKDVYYDHQGKVAGLIGVLVDITHIKESEQHLRSLLFQTITALASAIEHKDPMTAGHQRSVHDLALAIGQQLKLPPDQLEGLSLAAMIHDIGLLQVPTEILTRPRQLRPVEFELVKLHAQTGFTILQHIDFPWPIATMVQQHHENIDGSGYPLGLQGEAICLEAKIIRVADSLVAMTAHRPFRRAMTLPDACAELTRYAGTRYDEQVVNACLDVCLAGYRVTTE
ncbi:HD domain-containing protein [Aeromonas veronii]|nr:HD domain-containing protein [Aeromonas veronii]